MKNKTGRSRRRVSSTRAAAIRMGMESMAGAVEKREKSTRTKPRAKASTIRRALVVMSFAAVLTITLVATPKAARAGAPASAPEIDPGSMAGALTLLVGGVLALTDRARRV